MVDITEIRPTGLHPGGARGKAVVDVLRKAGAAVVDCPKVTRAEERLAFVRAEVARMGGTVSPDAAAALFRVVQEALTNVVRHADARHVRIALTSSGRLLRIAIADDGKGVARHEIQNRKSFGIVGMRERVHRIGGEFNIFSVPGRGTRLEISVPLK